MKKNNILILVLVGLVLLFVTTNYFKKHSSAIFKAEVIQFVHQQRAQGASLRGIAQDLEAKGWLNLCPNNLIG